MKRCSKTLLLSLILFFTIAPYFGQITAHADIIYDQNADSTSLGNDARYNNYLNLFSTRPNAAHAFGWSSWSQTNNAPDGGVVFAFNGTFNLSLHSNNGNDWRRWFWDHIANLYDDDDVFVVKTCPVDGNGALVKGECMLSRVESKINPAACDLLTDATCTNDVYTDAIYEYTHYSNGAAVSNDKDLLDSFSVKIPIAKFHPISQITDDDLESSSNPSIRLTPGRRYQSDLWYCAGNGNDPDNPNQQAVSGFTGANETKGIKFFGVNTPGNDESICRGQAHRYYIKIGNSLQFDYPKSLADATSGTTGTTADVVDPGGNRQGENIESTLPACSITNGKILWGTVGSDGSFLGCVAQVVFYGIYMPIQWFAGIMGNLFDFFLGYSLDDGSYRADFVVTAWKVIRDISNIFFILILVWTGLAAVFDIGKISMKQVVPNLIINALIINFSLFITRVAIDASNIFANIFYNTITVTTKLADGTPVVINDKGPGGYKPISEKIVSGFNPQKIFAARNASIEQYNAKLLSERADQVNVDLDPESKGKVDKTTSNYAGYYILVSFIAAAIMFAMAMMFWKTAFFFLGRVIGLYVVMIFSPFAFLTRGNMPLIGRIDKLKWDDWLKELTNYALLAPIFVFFLYIVYLLVQSPFLYKGVSDLQNKGFFEEALGIAIPMLIIYFIITYGVKIAERYAGMVGEMVQGRVNKITGGVGGIIGGGVGLAAGGAAYLGRNAIARPLDLISKKSGLTGWAAENQDTNGFARWTNAVINKNKTGSWDARNAGLKIGKKDYTLGNTLNKGVGYLGEKVVDNISGEVGLGRDKALGKGGKPGGIVKLDQERAKALAESIKKELSFGHLSDEEAKTAWARIKREKVENYVEKNFEKKATEEDMRAIAPMNEAARSAKAELDKAQKELEGAKRSGGAGRITLAQEKYDNLKKVREKAAADLRLEKERVAGVKAEDEEKRLARYGNIENVKAFSSAMRAEYAEKLRQGSMWMKDGKVKDVPIRGLGLSTAAMTAASLVPGIGSAFGAAFATYIQSSADVMDAATKNIIKEHSKNLGKGSTLARMMEKMAKINKDLQDVLDVPTNKAKYGNKKLDDFDFDELEEAISEAMATNQATIDELTDKLKAGGLNAEQKKAFAKERARLRQKIDRWKNAQTNKEKTQEDIDRHNENKKKEEEGKDKKEGDGKDDKDKK